MYKTNDIPVTDQNETVASRLRAAREAAKMTRKDVFEKTGIPLKSLEKFENGTQEPTVSRLVTLAQYYEVTVNNLLGVQDVHTDALSEPTPGEVVSLEPETKETASEIQDDQTIPGSNPLPNVNVERSQEDEHIPESAPETIEDVLAVLDQLRECNFQTEDGKRTEITNCQTDALAKIEQAHELMKDMEPDDLENLANSRGLYCEQSEVGFGLLALFEKDQAGADIIFQENIAERIIDTALFEIDLFAIERDSLAELAEELKADHDIEEPAWGGLYWGNHEQLVPVIRPILRDLAIQGNGYDFQNREDFFLRESEGN